MKSLRAHICEDWRSHGRDWTLPGFRALAIHRFGVWRMGIRWRVVRAPFSMLYRHLFRRARNVYGIELPYTARIGSQVVFDHQHGIVVHGNAVIGDRCRIRHGVTIGMRSMERPDEAPVIGCDVDIGAGAKVLGGIRVGDRAVIGANAVVVRDVPAGATVVGIPARQISRSPRD